MSNIYNTGKYTLEPNQIKRIQQLKRMRNMLAKMYNLLSDRSLAEKYNVSKSTIARIPWV